MVTERDDVAPTNVILAAGANLRRAFGSFLEDDGRSVHVAGDRAELEAVLDSLESKRVLPDLIIIDLRMPGGLELLECFHGPVRTQTPIMVVTALGDGSAEAGELRRLTALFELPAERDDLRAAVNSLLAPVAGDRT